MKSVCSNIKLMLEFLKALFLGSVLQYINDLFDDVTYDIVICADDTTLYSKPDQVSDIWQQLQLVFKHKSDLWDILDWGKIWLFDFNAGKTELILFDQCNNSGPIDLKMDVSVLEEKSSLKMLGLGLLHYIYCWNCL